MSLRWLQDKEDKEEGVTESKQLPMLKSLYGGRKTGNDGTDDDDDLPDRVIDRIKRVV